MKNEESANNDTINETNPKSTNETWIIIGGKKKWIRKCPNCNNAISYSHYSGFYRASKKNSTCVTCERIKRYNTTDVASKISQSLKGRIFSTEHKHHLSIASSGKNNAMYGKIGKLNPFYGKKHSIRTKKKIGKLSTLHNTGRKHSNETIKKWRIISINRKKKLGIFNNQPYYNPIACNLMNNYGKQHGYNFQHAMNGGEYHIKELGYWIDGYDKEKNIIFEYNEPHHYDINGTLKNKDKRRIDEIKKLLNCKVITYNGHSKTIEIL